MFVISTPHHYVFRDVSLEKLFYPLCLWISRVCAIFSHNHPLFTLCYYNMKIERKENNVYWYRHRACNNIQETKNKITNLNLDKIACLTVARNNKKIIICETSLRFTNVGTWLIFNRLHKMEELLSTTAFF